MILAMEVVASAAEVCVGITQMLQKSISRFLTLRITLSIALLRLAIYEVFSFKIEEQFLLLNAENICI